MTLDKSTDDNDNVFDQGDFKIVISKDYDNVYNNLEIEFVDNYTGKGFAISEKGHQCSSGCCS